MKTSKLNLDEDGIERKHAQCNVRIPVLCVMEVSVCVKDWTEFFFFLIVANICPYI